MPAVVQLRRMRSKKVIPVHRTISLRPTMLSIAMMMLSASLAACGGSTPPPDRDASQSLIPLASAKAKSPAEACLEIASAPREKKPNEPAKVGVKHILVKYAGAKSAADTVTRTREDACLRAMEARDKLREGADFGEMVAQYSDDPGAASRGGSMGSLSRGELVPSFADAAFELDINQLSDIVETEFGFHLILRTE